MALTVSSIEADFVKDTKTIGELSRLVVDPTSAFRTCDSRLDWVQLLRLLDALTVLHEACIVYPALIQSLFECSSHSCGGSHVARFRPRKRYR